MENEYYVSIGWSSIDWILSVQNIRVVNTSVCTSSKSGILHFSMFRFYSYLVWSEILSVRCLSLVINSQYQKFQTLKIRSVLMVKDELVNFLSGPAPTPVTSSLTRRKIQIITHEWTALSVEIVSYFRIYIEFSIQHQAFTPTPNAHTECSHQRLTPIA